MDDFDGFEDVNSPEGRAALIERLERERAEGEADVERRRAERLATPPPPDWGTYRDLNSMDQRTYSAWLDAGKPAIGMQPPPPPPPQPKPAERLVTKAMLDKETERTFTEIGKFIGQMDREVEARVEKKFAELCA